MVESQAVSEARRDSLLLMRSTKVILFIDVYESVRLIDEDEAGFIGRWLGQVEHAKNRIVPEHGGKIVKSLGDGIMLEFTDVRRAVAAAFAILRHGNNQNAHYPEDQHILLRMGIELDEVIVEGDDLFGRGVNVAARLLTLAGPGEIIVTAQVKDHLTAELDADMEDLGVCYLRHVKEPVRAYRIGPPGPHPVVAPAFALGDVIPTLAVIPFTPRRSESSHGALGEVLAEEVIKALSHTTELNVISRLSTTAFSHRVVDFEEIAARLKADYIVYGTFTSDERDITIDVEVADAKTGQVIASTSIEDRITGILQGGQEVIGRIMSDVTSAVMARELRRSRSQPVQTLKGYTLLIAAIALMHRLTLRDFEEARYLLQTLVDRRTRDAIPQAWLAKWHVLRVQQGWSVDRDYDAYLAQEAAKKALDADPDCSLALAMDGIVHTNLLRQLDVALERYEAAIQVNPNDSLAWLLKGTLHAFRGEGRSAIADTQRALFLSPLDPHRYFYDSLAATACYSAGDYENALALASRSLRANRTHTSTLRVLAASQWQLGMHDEARATGKELMRLEPQLTISGWLARSPSEPYATGREWADVLRQVGIPE